MAVNQIAVFKKKKKGRLHRFAKTLSDGNVNIEHMVIAESTDYGIVRAITNNNEKAVELLKANGYTVSSMNILGVEVSNNPGEFTKTLKILADNDINIEYMYSYPGKDKATILLRVNEYEKALKALTENGVKTL